VDAGTERLQADIIYWQLLVVDKQKIDTDRNSYISENVGVLAKFTVRNRAETLSENCRIC
jgi:hypothetical protein